ncbi:MAG: ATP-dependent DNA helicase UvrD2 [Acidimicrobiia bacterium]|nr:ATP-dependent DNA helicase UvrD2 [Acidimicrobiia bacterium]MCY4456868.1 UvrD-helicase domain-containing protein [Acidimicrobiaceae bacterium]
MNANREDQTNSLLATLSAEQREAVTTTASPLCIIAGAGSGKTRVLTRRLAWQSSQGNIDPRRALVLTFTRNAAAELAARLRLLGIRETVAAGTFHAAALALLRRYWDHNQQPHMQLTTNRIALLARENRGLDRVSVSALDGEIGWARAQLVTPENYADRARRAGRKPPQSAEFTASAYAAYINAKRRRRLIDFDDVLALCHAVLSQQDAFAETQRWYFRHLFVDEFQDVNPLQFAVLQAWLGAQSTLAVVGDPDQAIYGFNGADPDFICEIDQHFQNIAVIKLHTNYRSTPEVVAAAARVLNKEPQRAVRPSGDPPTITITAEPQEPEAIAQAIRAARAEGVSWRDQAVLARTNAQLSPLQKALVGLGVPTQSREQSLLRQQAIIDLLHRWPQNGALSIAIIDEKLRQDTLAEVAQEAPELISAFLALARDHLALEPDARVAEFVASLKANDRTATPVDAVELCTFHAAKGREWPIVHLIGLEDGLVPIAHARTRAARHEEQRLLYVAATRAKQRLHVMWCATRKINDKFVERSPTPWLGAFDVDKPAETQNHAAQIAALRIQLHRGSSQHKSDSSAAVLSDLQKWRSSAARAARIAPQAVLRDSTLHILARQPPANTSELSATIGPYLAKRFGEQLLAITNPQTATPS